MRAVVSGGCRVDWLLVVAKQTNKPITLVCNYSGLGTGTQLTRSGSEGAMSHVTMSHHVQCTYYMSVRDREGGSWMLMVSHRLGVKIIIVIVNKPVVYC